MTVYFAEMNHSKLQELNFASSDCDHPVTHNVGTGVKPQNYFFLYRFSHVVKLGRRLEF
jgi:hypothetical protein